MLRPQLPTAGTIQGNAEVSESIRERPQQKYKANPEISECIREDISNTRQPRDKGVLASWCSEHGQLQRLISRLKTKFQQTDTSNTRRPRDN